MAMLPKSLRDFRYRIFYGLFLRRGFELVTLGDQSFGLQWTVCPTFLNAQSVIYSAGVGDEISFERELVKRFGCNVVLLDPSPMGVRTMELPENQIPQFKFFPAALAGHTGKLKVALRPNEAEPWFVRNDGAATESFEIPCVDLQSLMKQNGHTHIDLLKLDIEGSEYDVIDNLLDRGIPVRQVCADFDYGYVPGVRRSQAIRSIVKMAARGYRLLHQDGSNHLFMRKQWPA